MPTVLDSSFSGRFKLIEGGRARLERQMRGLQCHRMIRKGMRLIFFDQGEETIAEWCLGVDRSVLAAAQTGASRPSAEWGGVVFSFQVYLVSNKSLESIHSKIGDVVDVKSYGSSMIPISVDGP